MGVSEKSWAYLGPWATEICMRWQTQQIWGHHWGNTDKEG